MNLLSSLGRLRSSLEDRNEYYQQPGSEYDREIEDDKHFSDLSRLGGEALQSVRDQLGPAAVFLSAHAVDAVEKLIREHWHTSESSICTADYIRSSLELVNAAYMSVLEEARTDLAHARA